MSKTVNKCRTGTREMVRYKTEALLASKALSGYQRDFAKALLTEPEYTIEEAMAVLERFFRKEGK